MITHTNAYNKSVQYINSRFYNQYQILEYCRYAILDHCTMTVHKHLGSNNRHYKLATIIAFILFHYISFHLPSSLKGMIHLLNRRHQSVPIDTIGIVRLTSIRARDNRHHNGVPECPQIHLLQ